MRWPFRRRAAEPGTGGEPATAGEIAGGSAGGAAQAAGGSGTGLALAGDPGAGSVGGAAQAAGGRLAGGGVPGGSASAGHVVRPPARQWATLPAIPTTIPLASPLVVGPAPVVPPLRLADRRGTTTVEAPVGSVTGLARPVVRAPETAVPVQPVDVAPPPMPRRAARPVPAETPTLVDAVDAYVGEPRVPAEPYRAPGWLRFMPDWAKQAQAQAIPGLPATPEPPDLPAPAMPDLIVAEPPSFLPPELRNPPKADNPPQAELPPRVAEAVAPVAETLTPQPVRRRPNLGQSRRLGLGAPIAKPDLVHPEEPPPIVDGTVETPQEPPPPPAAPARVVAEPAPGPEPALAPEPEPVGREPEERPVVRQTPPAVPPVADVTPTPAVPSPATGPQAQPGPVPSAKPVAATYRATAELRPAPRRERPRATVVDRVPPALASEVRGRQQADVSEVPVYRGPKVGEAAKSRGARAFAAGGAVFLPDEAGPVDSPRARGLLAHELVHAVQQRTLGNRLPAPDSPLGQRLEADAQAAERFYGGEAGAPEPPPLVHAPVPAPAPEPSPDPDPDLTAVAQLATELTAAPAPTQPAATSLNSPFDTATTEAVDRIATESARHVVAEWTNPRLQQGHARQQTAHHEHTAASGRTPGTFNAPARREHLIAARLAAHNSSLAPGALPLTHLSSEELTAIDHQVANEAALHGATGHPTHSTHSSHSGHHRPSATPSSQPPEQRYAANSSEAWMHAVTGMNMNYGFGEQGVTARVGSKESWFGSRTNDHRPVGRRLADQAGLINAGTATQFDTDTWWQPEEDEQSGDEDTDTQDRDNAVSSMDDAELDELATRLYDRLRSRLRTELLVDRERAGLLTDFR